MVLLSFHLVSVFYNCLCILISYLFISNFSPLLMLQFRVDMYYEGSRDFWRPFVSLVFRPEADILTEVKTRNIPRYMPIFEQVSHHSWQCLL